jgi:hypothetical protein
MMKNERKGTSALAALADGLPVRARVGLALIAADIAMSFLETSRHLSEAASAFDVARRWFDGEAVSTDQIQDTLYGEDSGLSLTLVYVDEKQEEAALLTLASALLYTAHHAYLRAGGTFNASVNEVDERELDEIDRSLWIIAPTAASRLQTAAQYLRTHPDASFRDLKAGISGPPQSPLVGS